MSNAGQMHYYSFCLTLNLRFFIEFQHVKAMKNANNRHYSRDYRYPLANNRFQPISRGFRKLNYLLPAGIEGPLGHLNYPLTTYNLLLLPQNQKIQSHYASLEL